MPGPRFSAADRPADIMDVAGRWLAAELGWRWVTTPHALQIRRGPLQLRLTLRPREWNRAGRGTWVSPHLTVSDEQLRAWRLARPDGSVAPAARRLARPWVCSTPLERVEPGLREAEFSGLPQPQPLAVAGLDAFKARLAERVLPVLELFWSPRLAAAGLPDSWLPVIGCPAIEWALAHGDRDAAALLIRRHLAHLRPGSQASQMQIDAFRKGWQLAPRRDGLPSLPEFSPQGLGWLARVHDLPAPDALHDPPPLSHT